MTQAIIALAHVVSQDPGNARALTKLVGALHKDGDLPALAAIIECWASVMSGQPTPAQALSQLYASLAPRQEPGTARKLCLAALDLSPTNMEALEHFEKHAGADDETELCKRYGAFLKVAPFHACSPRLRVKFIDRLLEAGRYDEALAQVSSLPPPSSLLPMCGDIERACSISPAQASRAGADEYEEQTQILEDVDIQFLDTRRGARQPPVDVANTSELNA